MAPNGAAIAGLLRQAVYYHLDNLSCENALFFAERLQAHDPRSSESTYLLALCHFRLGDSRSAYEVSKASGYRGNHLGCAFIFAQACLDLEKYKEGIVALEKSRGLWSSKNHPGKHSAYTRAPYPDAATASCLLGKLYRAYDDKKKAAHCFEDALKLNPLMWDAFTILCDMGAGVRVPSIFKTNEGMNRSFEQELNRAYTEQGSIAPINTSEPLHKKSSFQSVLHTAHDPFEARAPATQDMPGSSLFTDTGGENDFMSKITAARSRLNQSSTNGHSADGMETPSALIEAPSRVHAAEPPQAPPRRIRGVQAGDPALLDAPPKVSYRLGSRRRDKEKAQEGAELTESIMRGSALAASATERKRTASGHPVPSRPPVSAEEPRRSARLNYPRASSKTSSVPSAGAAVTREVKKARPPVPRLMRPGSSGTSVGRVVSGNRKPVEESAMDLDHTEASKHREPLPAPPISKLVEHEPIRVDEALQWILDLLKKLATGYQASTHFRGYEALSAFAAVPRAHQDTPWVLAQMGKAHFEQANYPEAEKFFRRLRILAPTRLEDMELYSTTLWHLKHETDLSFLAHELVDTSWYSPQAWCALGNAWSLAMDREQALRCFKRATQLDPKFSYAYTLQGHEHFANEEYDKALTSYRQAISADKRHYNAYYGMGNVYEKLGSYDKAFSHYHAASTIHPNNPILLCCLGIALERQKQITQALQYFSRAVNLAPKVPETRYRKARALLAMGKIGEAQQELMVLKDLAPDNAKVHFLLGRLAKNLRDKKTAVRHFTIALSLEPKAASPIKDAIENLDDEDGMDDSMIH